ncbi:hypothetical protein KIW84_033150 [Lathyrus oleraceus]|uniref:Uncharacterized protein n=1 Tax=Pisum sativum TaxID=3888 RepID=A0A9D4XZW3_PEA|nr:hypothetical protein KIW84_033150 [Pisum sativum]
MDERYNLDKGTPVVEKDVDDEGPTKVEVNVGDEGDTDMEENVGKEVSTYMEDNMGDEKKLRELIVTKDMWIRTDAVDMKASPIQRQPGRSKKKRNKKAGEMVRYESHMKQVRYKIKCSCFHKNGHNKSTCQMLPPQATSSQPPQATSSCHHKHLQVSHHNK